MESAPTIDTANSDTSAGVAVAPMIVLVDDVLYTGRTIRAAMNEVFTYGRPSSIKLCVLVDRGHRELPIKANFIGKSFPTSLNEHIYVHIEGIDGKDEVFLKEYKWVVH